MGISPDGRIAYVANPRSDDVTVVDVATLRVLKSVPAGSRAMMVAFSLD
ncbi:MAG: hypothetical protein ACK44W_08085, partial [Planctomycetota bacterium]